MTTSGPNPPQAIAVVVLAIGGAMASEDVEMDDTGCFLKTSWFVFGCPQGR